MRKTRLALLTSLIVGTAQGAPAIITFGPDNWHVVDGQPVKLTWSVVDAAIVRLNGQLVTGNSATVTPLDTTGSTLNYRLQAADAAGKLTAVSDIELSRGTVLNKGYIPQAYACEPHADTDYMAEHIWVHIEPRDCTRVRTATPVFSWPKLENTDNAVGMKFTLQGPGDYEYSVTTKEPSLILPKELVEPGFYTWTVQYQTLRGTPRTSQTRTFRFNGKDLPNVATGAEVRANILAKTRPRILPRDILGNVMTWPAIDASLRVSDQRASYKAYLEQALREKTPVGIPEPSSNAALDNTIKRIERLAMAGVLTGDTTYSAEAVRSLVKVAEWNSTNGAPTTEGGNDQYNRDILRLLAFGLDILDEHLTNADRDVIILCINARLGPLLTKLSKLHELPYDSHLLMAGLYAVDVMMHATGAVGATQRFDPAGKEGQLLEETWNKVIPTIGMWRGGSDSAFGNSTNYAWMSLNAYALLFADFKLTAGVDISHIQALDKFGENFYAQTIRKRAMNSPTDRFLSARSPFGDGADSTGTYFSFAWQSYGLFAHLTQNPIDEWYYRDKIEQTEASLLRPYHYLMTASQPRAELPDKLVLRSTYLFEDAGVVAMNTDTAASDRSSLFFRSSRLGSVNHSHADSNAFTFVSKGRDIFISGGIYSDFDSNFQQSVTRATRFKNAITFDAGEDSTGIDYTDSGIGQAEPVSDPVAPGAPAYSMAAYGRLINAYAPESSSWSIATGDATKAYQGMVDKKFHKFKPLLKNAVRTVAYNRAERVAVIYDWAESENKRRWQFNFQTLVKPTVISPRSIEVAVGGAGGSSVCAYIHGMDGAFGAPEDMADLFPQANLAPGMQFHNAYKTTNRHNQIASLTVLTEDCADNVPVIVTYLNGTKILVQRGESWLVFDKREVQISESLYED